MTHTNFYFNYSQIACCCICIFLGTKWFRFAFARWVFGTAAELSHPRILHQYTLWWFAPTVSLFVLNGLAYTITEDDVIGADARKKIALTTAISYTLWGVMNSAFAFLSQTLWDFEWTSISEEDATLDSEEGKRSDTTSPTSGSPNNTISKSMISNPKPIYVWPVVGWGLIGACGTCAVRNFLYFVDISAYETAIIIIGVVECVILCILFGMFIYQFVIPTLLPEFIGWRKNFHDVTKNHRLQAPFYNAKFTNQNEN